MKCDHFKTKAAIFVALACAGVARVAAVPASDINSPEKRRVVVELGVRLAKQGSPAAVPADLVSPFNPPGFELTDAEERTAAAAMAGSKTSAPKIANDREILEQISSKITPTGTMMLGGEPLLNFGKKAVKVGTHFTVTYPAVNGQDYDLELVSIGSTSFTLRLNREEITRPIKPGKSQ